MQTVADAEVKKLDLKNKVDHELHDRYATHYKQRRMLERLTEVDSDRLQQQWRAFVTECSNWDFNEAMRERFLRDGKQ